MSSLLAARLKAQARRQELGFGLEEASPAEDVLARLAVATGLACRPVPTDDPRLEGAQAVLNTASRDIFLDESRPAETRRVDAAHAHAHLWLHGGGRSCGEADLRGAEPISAAQAKVEEEGAQDRREGEANVCAAELLLPGPLARRLFLQERQSARSIAETLGLPHALVLAQLTEAVLLPSSGPVEERSIPSAQAVALDPFQQEAAQCPQGPLLLGAGPGTGKTKTLVGRCQFLTQTQGVAPEQILALTFSRKAADEMRERLVQAGVGTARSRPWVGTFHGFGLDLLRRYGTRLGLPEEIRLLDTLDGVTLLENHLERLELSVLDNLYNPGVHLRGILGQIGRAKDELCPPERYAELCRPMQRQADQAAAELAAKPGKRLKKDEDAVERLQTDAAKAREVAHCYAVYEELLAEGGYLDYADLIRRAVELLETCPDVRAELQFQFPHVLADEYQDVNRGCARLVKLLAGDEARGLWAVGDHRQSIYRFRGASPANVAAFGRDYPGGRRLELGVNYRSRTPIVEAFGVAARMMAGVADRDLFQHWQAKRGEAETTPFPAVVHAVAPDEAGQAQGIAQTIETLRQGGWSYRDHAILCRTHGQAEALVPALAARGIPVLYLGNVLERPEIKDLLCLLSVCGEGQGLGLLRLGALPEYGVGSEDLRRIVKHLDDGEATPAEALGVDGLSDSLSPEGRQDLQRLAEHLATLAPSAHDPAALLQSYLFDVSDFLRHDHERPFLAVQRRLAVYQLLSLAQSFDRQQITPMGQSEGQSRTRRFLKHLRRMAAQGESLRGGLPDAADALDAVRVLTAHAAKGLEYPVVFVPNLGDGQFPARGRHDGIPQPPGLVDMGGDETDEEDCLFFVAVSRARDHLILSRTQTKGDGKPVKPSPLLRLIQPWLDTQRVGVTAWTSGQIEEATEDIPASPTVPPTYASSALEQYARCPRQYFYERELKLTGAFHDGGYPQFHRAVRETLQWLDAEWQAGRRPDTETLQQKSDELWAAHGPAGHRHEARYRETAAQMLRMAHAAGPDKDSRFDQPTLTARLDGCRVLVRPDVLRISKETKTLTLARQMTGKPGGDDHTDKRLALYRKAARDTCPDLECRVEVRYLADGTAKEIPPSDRYEPGRLEKYAQTAQGITARRFPAQPASADECHTCAFALICPL